LMLHPVFSLPIAASHRSTRLPCEAPVRAHLKDEEQQWNQVVKIMAAAVQST
jgi:hypothetical protein